ncbi:hypothetical protein BDZ45DRAFT_748734 [Acephala macrosclerotiorum]|nr:hypothetical protein BDZ45DRAFT_748734 [Acephala macrosclerotiorum]
MPYFSLERLTKAISTNVEEFALFSELLKELRLQIWEHTFDTPTQVVRMYFTVAGDPNPVVLSVCYESRELVSKTYEPLLHDYPPNNFLVLTLGISWFTKIKFSGFHYIRFNFTRDKLVFSRSHGGLPDLESLLSTQKVHKLDLDLIEHESTGGPVVPPSLRRLKKDFPRLRSLEYMLSSHISHPEATMNAL